MPGGLTVLMALLMLLLLSVTGAVAAPRPLIAFGDPFPELVLPAPDSATARRYLGLAETDSFTPSQVGATLVLVELLNVHCAHCQMQAPAYNELFRLVEADPGLRGKVKLLGIALGNTAAEVERFRAGYQVPFPIVADPRFVAYRALGIEATPFSIVLRQDRPGQPGLVAATHEGLDTDYRSIAERLRRLLATPLAELRRDGERAVQNRTAITPLYSEEQLELKVRNAFIATGGRLGDLRRLELRSGRRVYTAVMQRGGEEVRLFAEVASRRSVCDICHDIHFLYLFDATTRVVGFAPLQITKYGNVLWSAAEAEAMRRRVVGQYLTAPRPFDPALDAVSAATISSAMIFDSLAQGEELLGELQALRLLP